MQSIRQQQRAARADASYYYRRCDFMGMMGAGEFDEEVDCGERWVGLVRDEHGMLQVHAEYVYDKDSNDELRDAGTGWFL